MFKSLFSSLAVFLSLNPAFAGMSDIEDVRDLDHFSHPNFAYKEKNVPEVISKFEHLEGVFPWNADLKRNHTKYLIYSVAESEEDAGQALANALKPLAEVIRGPSKETDADVSLFMQNMYSLNINGIGLAKLLTDIDQMIRYPRQYAASHKIKGGQKEINKQFLNKAKLLFNTLSKTNDLSLYEAMLRILHSTTEKYKVRTNFSSLVGSLYLEGGDKFSPALQIYYANIMLAEKKYQKAQEIFEDVIGANLGTDRENIYQTIPNYSMLGQIYFYNKDFDRSITCFENILMLDPSIDNAWNVAVANFSKGTQESYEAAIEQLYRLKSFPDLDKSRLDKINENLLTCLQKVNREKEAQEILLRKQQESFLEAERLQKEKTERAKKNKAFLEGLKKKSQTSSGSAVQSSNVRSPISTSTSMSGASSYDSTSYDYTQTQATRDFEPLTQPKEKVKTRGKADPQRQVTHAPEVEQDLAQRTKVEDILKPTSSHYATFCDLFRSVDEKVTNKQIKISMTAVSSLMEALGQDFDKSKGKGSHTKVTLNFQEHGLDADEEMLILSNKTYLLPYQIEKLRNKFIGFGLYPEHMAEMYESSRNL